MAIKFLSGVNIDSNTLFVDSTNNKVGIGISTPSAKLDIDGAHVASIGLLRLNSNAANMSAMTYYIDGVYKAATYAGTDDNFYVWGRDADIVFNTTTSGTTRMVITNGGNVGIGISGPTQKLTVGGSIRVTGGYYDSSNSVGSNGQVLASTGTGTTWINASGGTVNGSGTVNYLSKWTGTTLLGDSQLFDNGTNVGVGTGTPNRKLTVSGNGTLLGLQSDTAGGYSEMEFTANGVGAAYIFKLSSGNSSYAGAGSLNIYNSAAIGFHTASVSNAMFIASSTGNIGLGNTNPTQKLHVEGNIRVTGAYYDSANGAGSSGQVLSSTGSGTSWITPFSGSGTTNYVAKWTSGTALGNSSIFDNGTNVGIGTSAPNTKLRIQESGTNPPLAIQNTNADGYTGAWLYNSAGTLVGHFGWGNGTTTALSDKMYFGTIAAKDIVFTTSDTEKVRITSGGNVGIGTTSPSRLLHVAGNAQVDGWIFQGGYYTGSVTLPYPGANYGNGRIYLRLCSSASGRIMTARVRISSTWNWAAAFGSVEADISFHWDGSSLVYSYVNILSATGLAATNLTFGALAVEGGSISVPVYSINSNPIYAYIQLSPDADPSQVSYSTWSSVAFPGQSNVYVQTNLGVGTPSPAYRLDVNGVARFQDQVRFKTDIWQLSDSDGLNRFYFSPGSRTYFGSGDGYEWRSSSDTALVVITNGGNLGINETAPSQRLHVSGNVRVTGAYYDSANAAGTSGQILSSTGTGTAWISPGGGGGIITGSGTTNYVTKWTGTSAVGDSSIFDNGNVGIGTTSPASLLHISGSGNTFTRYTNTTNAGHYIDIGANGAGQSFIYGYGAYPLLFATSGSEAMRIASGGNVGIGTTTPQKPLEAISGANDFVSVGVNQISVGNWTGIHFGYREANTNYRKSAIVFERTDLTANDAQGKIHILNGPQGGSGSATLADAKITIAENGNIGIGSTSPISKVQSQIGANGSALLLVNAAGGGGAYVDLDFNTYSPYQSGYANPGASIRVIDDGAYSGHITFRTKGAAIGAAQSEKVRIQASTGNFGIGTTNPQYKLEASSAALFGTTAYGVLNIAGDNPAYIKIRTAIPFSYGAQGYTVNVKGFQYGSSESLDLQICWHQYADTFYNPTITSKGSFAPVVRLARESGLVVIVLTWGQYWPKLYVESVHNYVNDGYANGWSWVDENVTGDKTVTLSYKNNFGDGFVKTASGNVGIGITGPSYKLSVNGDAGIEGSESYLYFHSSATVGSNARARMRAVGAAGGSGYGGDLRIDTRASNNVWNENVVTVSNNGNVGIGETAPSQKLHVSGNIRVTGAYYDSANSAGTSGQILSSTATGTAWIAAPSGGITGSGTTNYVTKWTSGSAVGNSSIYDNGNVGIGTTAPTAKLQVEGDGIVINTENVAGAKFLYFRYSNGGDIRADSFLTFSTGGSPTEKMRITSGGTLLVGDTVVPSETAWLGTAVFGKNTYNKVIIGSLNSTTTGAYVGGHNSALNAWADLNVAGTALIFRTNETERMRLASDGNFGINTTNPQALLHVQGTGLMTTFRNGNTGVDEYSQLEFVAGSRAAYIWLGNQNTSSWAGAGGLNIYTANGNMDLWTGATQRVRITNAGNVGIGTMSPMGPLEVYKANSGGLGGHIILNNDGSAVGNETAILFNDSGVGSVSSVRAAISSTVEGAPYLGDIKFKTGVTTYGSLSTRMIITGAGNVGIGTTAPTAKLHIDSTDDNAYALRVQGNTNNSIGVWTGIGIAGESSNTKAAILFEDIGVSYARGKMHFALNNATDQTSATPANAVMTLIPEGNVGIGTTAPNSKLSVNGGDFEFNRGTGALGNNYVLINKGASNDGGIILRRDNVNDFQIVNVGGTGNLTFYSYGAASEVLTIVRSNGNVGINNTNASYKLDVTGDARINTGALGVNVAPSATDGRIDASNDIVAFSSSDLRLKENIKPIENALEKVKSLTGVEFDWKPELKHAHGYEGHDTGVIAQEVQEVMPTAIRTNDTGYLAVRYEKLIGLLIEAVKEQQAEIDELKSKLK